MSDGILVARRRARLVMWPLGMAVAACTALVAGPSAEQAGAKYPSPAGIRGWGPSAAARYWGLTNAEYAQRADVWPLNPDGELLAIAIIESREGVKNVEEILRVPGLGGVLIGPADLSLSLG